MLCILHSKLGRLVLGQLQARHRVLKDRLLLVALRLLLLLLALVLKPISSGPGIEVGHVHRALARVGDQRIVRPRVGGIAIFLRVRAIPYIPEELLLQLQPLLHGEQLRLHLLDFVLLFL